MGSFRPGAGNQHLHWYFNFTGCIVETVLKVDTRLSCGSELTRQGIPLHGVIYSYGRRLLGLKFKASLKLTSLLLTFQHWAGVSPYFTFRFHIDLFLLKQLLEPILCAPHSVGTFSEVGVILPNSLNNAFSSLRILSYPPVSVYTEEGERGRAHIKQ